PETYMELREDLYNMVDNSRTVIKEEFSTYKKMFNRGTGNGMIDEYKVKDADVVLITMGSVIGTMKDVVDELREKGQKVGILKIRCFRPFPSEDIVKALAGKKHIAVIEKAVSMGNEGVLSGEVKQALDKPVKPFVVGLGGKDVTKGVIKEIIKKAKSKPGHLQANAAGKDKKLEFIYPE
ncbi:hypothetical protein KKF29_02300, partial [Patescibacteria group bacterium]|nr:hypothetical protein [Patescibacteria group bacterium]